MIETIVKDKIPHNHSITIAIFTNTEDARFYPKMMGCLLYTSIFRNKRCILEFCGDKCSYGNFKLLCNSIFRKSMYAMEKRSSIEGGRVNVRKN